MSGSAPSKVMSFATTVVIPEKYVFVVIDTGSGTCKLPTAAADRRLALGIVQQTADKVGEAVAVVVAGESYLKMNGAVSRGDRVQASVTAGKEGRGLTMTAPSAPANASGGGTNAEVDAVRDYVTALFDYEDKCAARAQEEASGADGDLITVKVGNRLSA